MPPLPNTACSAKRRRVTQACDFCHHRGLKCKLSPPKGTATNDLTSCLTCVEYGQQCTRLRQPQRRGTKPRHQNRRQRQSGSSGNTDAEPNPPEFGFIDVHLKATHGPDTPTIRSRKIITTLLDVYLDTIHPIFPFFCERDLWVGWRDGSFPADQADYMSLICMCALSIQHVGSGALFSDDLPATETTLSLSQDYLAEALRVVSLDFEEPCLNQIRSCGLLALLGAQSADKAMIHKYMGLYHGLCARWHLHDEGQWPRELSDCEREVRRRLWWIMYRLEVHTACVFGSLVRCPEAQVAVGYPAGLHHPAFLPGRDGRFEDWFAGWNSATDLYRILEHVIAEFRLQRRSRSSILGGSDVGTQASANSRKGLSEKLSLLQNEMLPHFRFVSSPSSDSGRNRCGFQASNILCTIHLAWMISTLADGDFPSACQRADDMITAMSTIPMEYVRAIGSPLLQQLAGVGHMLAGVASKRQLSREHQERYQIVMESIIKFLSRLAENSSTAATEKQRLMSCLAETQLAPPLSVDALEDNGAATQTSDEPLIISDNFEDMFTDLNDFFSTHLAKSLTWPYNEPRQGE